MQDEIQRYRETNENSNTTCQKSGDAGKAVMRGKFMSLLAYLKKQEKSQVNNLTLPLTELEKEEQKQSKACRRKQ